MGASQSTHNSAPVPADAESVVASTEMVTVDVTALETPVHKPINRYTIESAIEENKGPTGRSRAMTFTPAVPENSPTILTFSNLIVTTKTAHPKMLLKDISGNITGGFWAIMGSSGSGKTTLLSTLSLRLDTAYMDIQGEFRLNGREYSRAVLKAMSAYVMQDDLLHAELTVEETLFYAAHLRMPKELTNEERMERVNQVIELMGIQNTRKVIIGDTRRKGISGGERKRVCVAIELLSRPKLLFLDEPTSGLDSTTAFSVCKALKHLADMGECTVVCTIHQPQPKIFRLFDNLILMKQGNIVYQGHAMKVVGFLDSINSPCPPDANLADHLMDVVSIDKKNTEGRELDNHKLRVPVDLAMGLEKPLFTGDGAKSWIQEFLVLSHRCFLQYFRRWDIIVMNLFATILISVFIGFGFWHHIGDNPKTVSSIRPSVFFAMVNQGVVGSLQTVITFPQERAIMLRERQAGAYQVSSYFMARTICDMLTMLWPPILFSVIVYYSVEYERNDGHKYGMYMLFCILDAWAATALCTAVVCICVSIERSSVVLSFLFEVSRLFGGYYTSPKQLHQYPGWKWADALSYIKYAYIGAINVLLKDVPGSASIIATFAYDEYTPSACVGYLIVLIVGFRLLGYLGLRYLKM